MERNKAGRNIVYKSGKVTMDTRGFDLLSDYVPGIIQEIRYFSTYNFLGERVTGYEKPCAIATVELARALREVAGELNVQGYRLKVFDAYRPAGAVKHFVLWGVEDLDQRMKPFFYPQLEKQELFVKGYIASKSSHSRGSAVDLTLLDMKTGKEVDMGSPFDYFSEASHPDYDGVKPEQHDNRMFLQKAMIKVGNSYGAVFELLNARSFTKILTDEPQKLDWCVQEFVKLLKKIHGTAVPEGKLGDIKETVLYWVSTMQNCLPAEAAEKLLALVEAVPHDNHMIHGDFHTKNIELQNDEVLLIDMDTLSVGNPVFELAHIYNSLIGFSEWDHGHIKRFQGYDFETAKNFWAKTLAAYLETKDEAEIRKTEEKIRIVSYTRLLSRSIRRREYETETGSHEFGLWKSELLELLDKTDTLLF